MNTPRRPRLLPAAGHHLSVPSARRFLFGVLMLPLALFLLLHGHLLFPGMQSWHDQQRLYQLLLFACAGLGIMLSPPLRRVWLTTLRQLPRTAWLALGVIFGLGVLSSLTAQAPVAAVLETAHMFLLLALASYVAALAQLYPRAFGHTLTVVILLAAGMVLLKFGVNYGFGLALGYPATIHVLTDGYANIRHFAQFQSWTLPLLLLPLLWPQRFSRGVRIAAFSIATGWWLLLYLGFPRGTLLGVAVAVVVPGLIFRARALPLIRWLALTGGAGLVAWYVLFIAVPRRLALGTSQILASSLGRDMQAPSERIELWSRALSLIGDDPLLGAGPLHYACAPGQITYAHAHSFPLQFAAEWGLPAAVLLAALLGWALFAWLRQARVADNDHRQTEEAPLRMVLTASLLTAGTHSLVSGVMVMPVSQVMFSIVTGYCIGLWAQTRQPSLPEHPATAWKTAALPLLALLTVLFIALPQAFRQTEARTAYQAKYRAMPSPGYWQQGAICEWPIAWWEAYPQTEPGQR